MTTSLESSPESASDDALNSPESETVAETIHRAEPRNLIVLALYQITVRVGWIFKTESVVIPAFLDFIGGGPILRGMLPVLNKFGLSIPPVLVSGRLKKTPLKKWPLLSGTLAMSLPFIVLGLLMQSGLFNTSTGQSGIGQTGEGSLSRLLPWLFLSLYGLFACFTGLTQLASHTLQGKLIRPNRRGRLLALSMALGTPAAILAAWSLLGGWLDNPSWGYGYIFVFCGCLFAAAAACALMVSEPAVKHHDEVKRPREHFLEAMRVVKTDPDFRRLAIVIALYSVVFMLFPHYQAMGLKRFDFNSSNLLPWVLVQNVGVGVFSLVAGPAADRWGNRLVLRIVLFFSATPPILATILTSMNPDLGQKWFWLVFLTMGTMPVVHRILSNYTLEISSPADHPRYISTLGLCVALPIMVGSPLVGLLISLLGYAPVCLCGAALILLGGFYTFRLSEPRHTATGSIEEQADTLFELDE